MKLFKKEEKPPVDEYATRYEVSWTTYTADCHRIARLSRAKRSFAKEGEALVFSNLIKEAEKLLRTNIGEKAYQEPMVHKIKKKRYYVDERVDCIAVRDISLKDGWEEGLHRSTKGVVHYFMGSTVLGVWSVPDDLRERAKKLCVEMNKGERR